MVKIKVHRAALYQYPYMLEPTAYAFSLYSIPTALAALGILALGIAVLTRERISSVSTSFLALSLAVSIWLLSFSLAYSSSNAATAAFWLRFAYLGVPFIAPAT